MGDTKRDISDASANHKKDKKTTPKPLRKRNFSRESRTLDILPFLISSILAASPKDKEANQLSMGKADNVNIESYPI